MTEVLRQNIRQKRAAWLTAIAKGKTPGIFTVCGLDRE